MGDAERQSEDNALGDAEMHTRAGCTFFAVAYLLALPEKEPTEGRINTWWGCGRAPHCGVSDTLYWNEFYMGGMQEN